MNWDQVEGKWKQMKGTVRQKWGKLTDDDFDQIAGNQQKFIGRLQERYGYTRERAQKELDEWMRSETETEAPRVRTGGSTQ